MTREAYLKRLEELLEEADPKEKEDAIAYCKEYFDEADNKDIGQIIKELGTPEEFVKQLQSEVKFKKKITPPEFKPQAKPYEHNRAISDKRRTNKIVWIGFIICCCIAGLVFLGGMMVSVGGLLFGINTTSDVVTKNISIMHPTRSWDLVDTSYISVETNRNVIIKKGDVNKVNFEGFYDSEVDVYEEDGKQCIYGIKEQDQINDDSEQYIEIIVSDAITYLDIESNMGNVELENIHGTKLDVDGELGNIDINNISFDEISLENELGNISGSIVDSFEEYRYTIENELGNTQVGEILASGEVSTTGGNELAMKSLEVKCELGNIDIRFSN